MPTTNKTPKLGLNNWVGTDKPKRSDFVEDNILLDTILSGHLADKAVHLSANDRTALEQPIATGLYAGDGTETGTLVLSFVPRAVFAFFRGHAMSEYHEEKKYTYVNAAAATRTGNTPGIVMGSNKVQFTQTQTEPQAGGCFLNMNSNGGQYFYIAFR